MFVFFQRSLGLELRMCLCCAGFVECWGGANGFAGEFAGVKGSYLTALMPCILESFSARWIGLLRVALNSTNDTLERRSATLRCVITAECSVTGRHTMKSACRRRAHAKYPECMASVEKRLHDVVVRAGRDFHFIDKLKWHVLPQFYFYYLFFINFFCFFLNHAFE